MTSAQTAVIVAASGESGEELHPNLTAKDCFEYPKIEVEGKVIGEGTERITACGYPTPENVGAEAITGKKCSELPEGKESELKANTVVEGKLFNKSIDVSPEHVTMKKDCIVGNWGGGCGPANEAGCPSVALKRQWRLLHAGRLDHPGEQLLHRSLRKRLL